MRVVIQRVKRASVEVEGAIVGEIQQGLLLFIGIEKTDNESVIKKAIERILAYRVFSDNAGKMNLNVQQADGELLLVSQFTLAANTQSGLRPSFSSAAPPAIARDLYNVFVETLNECYLGKVATGQFAADMQVSLTNDGPVTFVLDFN